MPKHKKKRSNPLLSLLLLPLDALDKLLSLLGNAFVRLLHGLFRLLLLLFKGLFRLVALLLRLLVAPFALLLRRVTAKDRRARQCLVLDGFAFERYAALVLRDNGFKKVRVTQESGDQGVDILAELDGITYAIQCKNYTEPVGNFAVQEAFTGCEFYGCDRAAVLTPASFTPAARELARETGVLLWDGKWLSRAMQRSGRKPRSAKV